MGMDIKVGINIYRKYPARAHGRLTFQPLFSGSGCLQGQVGTYYVPLLQLYGCGQLAHVIVRSVQATPNEIIVSRPPPAPLSTDVMETLGGLAEDSISILRSLGKPIAKRVGCSEALICIKQLFHKTAIALWRGNTTLWLHSQPTLPPSVDGLVQFLHVHCMPYKFNLFT